MWYAILAVLSLVVAVIGLVISVRQELHQINHFEIYKFYPPNGHYTPVQLELVKQIQDQLSDVMIESVVTYARRPNSSLPYNQQSPQLQKIGIDALKSIDKMNLALRVSKPHWPK